ncbi:MAG: hypothetical protein NE334_09560 [Lentisphaeraceae bacterium]|nr:hypothetical protein [Lentisphaeraceae bacterium]
MKLLFSLVLVFFVSSSSFADESLGQVISSASTLIKDSSDKQSLEFLREKSFRLKNGPVKNKMVTVVGLILKKSDSNSYDGYKKEITGFDFSKIDSIQDIDETVSKSLAFLVLNSAGQLAELGGNSPRAMIASSAPTVARVEQPEPVQEVPTSPVTEQPEPVKEVPTVAETLAELDAPAETPKTPQDISKDSIYYLAYHAAKKVQDGNNDGIKELLKYSVEDHNDNVNGMLVKTISLAMINSGSKSLKSYFDKVNRTFPEAKYLSFLEEEPFQAECTKCQGKGHEGTPCRKCYNGKCKNCKGKGAIVYRGLGGEVVNKNCPTCKGEKICSTCEGSGESKKDCRLCRSKGSVFAKSAVPVEYAKSLQNIIDLMPKFADEEGIYIGVGINKLALARIEQERQAKEEKKRLMAELASKEQEQAELAKLAAEQREKEFKSEGNEFVREVVMDEFEEGGTNPTLKHALLEMENYLKAQEKREKKKIYTKADAKFVNSLPTLMLDVTDLVGNSNDEYKQTLLDGFYRFWKLRCSQNGLGGTVGYVVNYNGQKIAEMKKNEVSFLD